MPARVHVSEAVLISMTRRRRLQAQREYGRNMRFARQFREFATAGTPRTPLQVHVEGSGDGADGINAKLLPAGAFGSIAVQ